MDSDACSSRMVHKDKVDLAKSQDLEPGVVGRISQLFKIFSDPGRLRIIYALSKQEMCVCDLAVLIGVSESAVSHQLRLLRAAELVKNRREGTVLYYSLKNDRLHELVELSQSILRT